LDGGDNKGVQRDADLGVVADGRGTELAVEKEGQVMMRNVAGFIVAIVDRRKVLALVALAVVLAAFDGAILKDAGRNGSCGVLVIAVCRVAVGVLGGDVNLVCTVKKGIATQRTGSSNGAASSTMSDCGAAWAGGDAGDFGDVGFADGDAAAFGGLDMAGAASGGLQIER